ncbi:beta/gamma crystallin-related protein [Nostoc sp. JL33]|uniref:beta/gamma crystallin-related protein n=1 Tax=Nostoc sp. JL33 TaxID=2815396 RepID=UPI0025F16C2C|nr:beta/gamma crystallin-related protein [Nostoc sp. JL33]MBN3874044.1 peptidase inhibitor family I36 protein [Nostoc sp. JL33]
MSNINNYGVDINNKTLAELSFSAVKELSDEVAATCSGGSVSLFRDGNFKGGGIRFSNSDANLSNNNFNDATSSIVITGNQKWRFYKNANFKGPSVTLGRGRYPRVSGGLNDSITSLKRIS